MRKSRQQLVDDLTQAIGQESPRLQERMGEMAALAKLRERVKQDGIEAVLRRAVSDFPNGGCQVEIAPDEHEYFCEGKPAGCGEVERAVRHEMSRQAHTHRQTLSVVQKRQCGDESGTGAKAIKR